MEKEGKEEKEENTYCEAEPLGAGGLWSGLELMTMFNLRTKRNQSGAHRLPQHFHIEKQHRSTQAPQTLPY